LKLSKDGWAGLAVAAASCALFGLTFELKPSPLVPIGPGFYPRAVLALTALLAAALVGFDVLRAKPERSPGPAANYAAVALHFAVCGLYVVALPWLGFRIATFAYVAATNALMDPPRAARGWLRIALIAFGTVLVTYFAFERYLFVLLPRGRWTDF
jgi:putative tricarboxylic transport membrane protein